MNDIKNIALATAIGIAGAGAAYLMATKKIDKQLVKETTIELQEAKNLNSKDYEKITKDISKLETEAQKSLSLEKYY